MKRALKLLRLSPHLVPGVISLHAPRGPGPRAALSRALEMLKKPFRGSKRQIAFHNAQILKSPRDTVFLAVLAVAEARVKSWQHSVGQAQRRAG